MPRHARQEPACAFWRSSAAGTTPGIEEAPSGPYFRATMTRSPLFAVKGKTITAEHVARLFAVLAGREPTAEEMIEVRSTLAEHAAAPHCRQAD